MKMNTKITFLKKATLSAVIGHGAALLFLFLSSALLVKNEDPFAFASAVTIGAFLVGAAVCGIVSGKSGGIWRSLTAGLVFSLLLIGISLVLDAALPQTDGDVGYGIATKAALTAGATAVSALVGLLIGNRKNSRSGASKRRKKAIDKYISE